MEKNPRKNSEGYLDLTAYYGSKSVVKQERKDKELDHSYRECMHLMLSIATICGFEVEGRIQLRHKKTGKFFK